MVKQTEGDYNGFDIREGRAMVSLGPLSSKRYCSYRCAFCYVNADFASYPRVPVDEIVQFLYGRRGDFDIVYVSGDTDSLAHPRTREGIDLIERCGALGVDVLFTTRAPLGKSDLDRLGAIGEDLRRKGRILFGCVSICRLRSAPHLEPPPIPAPERRLEVLAELRERGITAVLAMRPFLPVVPTAEYVELVEMAAKSVDVVLGETWYADAGGVLEAQVLAGESRLNLEFEAKRMDFDKNQALWKVWPGSEIERTVAEVCKRLEIPFFMRSRPAIEYVRGKRG